MAVNIQNINAKSVAKYMLLPGILPRAKELSTSGFGYLAFLFANVYRAVRILPANHSYLNPDNIGKFGIIQVIAAAANNIEFKRRNIDQMIVFVAMVAAVILMFIQFILLLMALFSGRAFAADASFKSMFVTENPAADIAFMMLDLVFGIPASGGGIGPGAGWFGSMAIPTGPTPFHEGMHALFQFYNLAILVVAVLIFLYLVMVVVIETAQTGVPFGQRFSKIYAPFRLIAAIGLLVPLNYGFNGAQYLTLYAAKLGSSFATNGWILFNESIQNPMGADKKALVAKPRAPSIDELLYFSSVYHACRVGYEIGIPWDYMQPNKGGRKIEPYIIVKGKAQKFIGYSYRQAKTDFGNTDIEILLGEEKAGEHKAFAGGVRPYCGKMTISLNFDNPANYKPSGGRGNPNNQSAIRGIEETYYVTVQGLLKPTNVFNAFGERYAYIYIPVDGEEDTVCRKSSELKDSDTCEKDAGAPPVSSFQSTLASYRTGHEVSVQTHYEEYRDGLDHKITEEIKKRGWGGAGIWYNNIADMNGVFTGAIYATPSVKSYPEIMEEVKKQRQMQNTASDICHMYEPNIGKNQSVEPKETGETKMAKAMNATYMYFACEKTNEDTGKSASTAPSGGGGSDACDKYSNVGSTGKASSANAFIDAINLIFGINGLFDIRCNSEIDPATGLSKVHPLAQLSTVGKSLVENAIRSMGMAVGAAFGGGILGALSPSLGAALQSASGMFVGIATIGLTAGFILYYILPFLPFIYFFFAVGSWVKSVFEAMVGMPLWALAHLRIDGDGFSGRAAKDGYFLLFEIFLRPIVTVFGLIGGMATFGAMAGMLNELFELVTTNITGAAPGQSTSTITVGSIETLRRGVIDQFFFTIMYAILLYMMATSSFKMIDTIPKGIMRWIGSGVPTFNDNKGDPTQNLTQYAAVGGNQIASQVLGGVTSGAAAAGNLGGSALKGMMGNNNQQGQ